MRVFNVRVEETVHELLPVVEIAYAHIDECWYRAAKWQVDDSGLKGHAKALARGRVIALRERMRKGGELLGTRTALLSLEVNRVLRKLKPDGPFPAMPVGVASLPGRRLGVTRQGFSERKLNVQLPDDLGEQVRCAAYWLSLEATTELEQWAARHGPGPAAGGLALLAAALRGFPTAEQMEARRQARAQIVTTGMILRQAVWQVIDTGPPSDTLQRNLQDKMETAGRQGGREIARDVLRELASQEV